MSLDYVFIIEPDDAEAFEKFFSNKAVKRDKMFTGCTWLDVKQDLFEPVGFFTGDDPHAVMLAKLDNGTFWVDLTIRYGSKTLDQMASFAYNLISRHGKVFVYDDSAIFPDEANEITALDADLHYGKEVSSLHESIYPTVKESQNCK